MDCYIELRFGQMEDVQREIVPVSSINTVFVDMVDPTRIIVDFTINDKTFRRKEYYENVWQCNRRWNEIRKIMGVEKQISLNNGCPIPMEAEMWNQLDSEDRLNLIERMRHTCWPKHEDGDDKE